MSPPLLKMQEGGMVIGRNALPLAFRVRREIEGGISPPSLKMQEGGMVVGRNAPPTHMLSERGRLRQCKPFLAQNTRGKGGGWQAHLMLHVREGVGLVVKVQGGGGVIKVGKGWGT